MIVFTWSWIVAVACLASPPPPTGTSADAVTLRDGKVLLGQVVDSDRRGPVLILARREWLANHLPDRLAVWEKAEAPQVRRAEAQRLDRLTVWNRDRQGKAAEPDRITPWLVAEIARLSDPGRPLKTPLILLKLGRTEVKAVDRKAARIQRMLRLGWLANFPEVEGMSTETLAQALEGRGFATDLLTSVSVDCLLPIPLEDDTRWLVRRASTELTHDPGGRLIRYQGMVLPEPAPGEAPPAASTLNAALGGLKELLGEAPTDPLPGKLQEMAGQGRVGAIVTRLELAADLSSVAVASTLWVRAGGRWSPIVDRSSTVRADDLPVEAGAGLADDPQVKAAFGLVESLGLVEVAPDLKRRSLGMGAATRKALGLARSALDKDLEASALSIEPGPNPKP